MRNACGWRPAATGSNPGQATAYTDDDADYNATSWKNQTYVVDECECNRTNLTMMVDEDFLYKWRSVDNHRISHLSEAIRPLMEASDLQVCLLLKFVQFISL